MRKSVTILLIACFSIASFGGINVSGDSETSVEIGQYERVTGSGDLSGEHVEELASGLRFEGPLFTNTLRVVEDFLEVEVGKAWSADKPFVLENGKVVVSGRTVEFSPLKVESTPVFTMGSRDQIQFQDRPMWVSAQQAEHGATITLDMEDGDTSGQEVFISKDWLWSRGIHRPVVVHEDGSDLPAVPTQQRDGWVIDMHHFSYVEISPTELVVFSRQEGLVVPHTGEVRWYESEDKLEIDVGGPNDCGSHVIRECTEIDQDILVDKDWLDMRINDLALRDHPWVITQYEGDDYYQVNLTVAQTPTTIVFEQFHLPAPNTYTRGSLALIRFSEPVIVNVTAQNGQIQFSIENVDQAPALYATVNASWLQTLEIQHPKINSTQGLIQDWGVINYEWLQFPLPSEDTTVLLTESEDDNNPGIGLIGDLIGQLDLGEKCEESLGDVAEVETFEEGASEAGVFVAGTTFCFEWNLWDPRADFYNSVIALTDGDSEIKCGAGEETDSTVTSQEGFRTCEWPDGEDFISGTVHYHILSQARWMEIEDSDISVASAGACAAGALIVVGTAVTGFFFAPAWAFMPKAAMTGGSMCVPLAAEVGWEILDEDENVVGEEILYGLGSRGNAELVGTNEVDMWDPGDDRGDSWSVFDLEYQVERPDSWDGKQAIFWGLKDTSGAKLYYSTDISIVEWMDYDSDQVDMMYGTGGGNGDALVTTFEGDAGGRENTIELSVLYPGGDHALDWEAPEPYCVLLDKIVSVVNGAIYELGFDNPFEESPECKGLLGDPEQSSQSPSDPWLEFAVGETDLSPEDLISNNGTITGQDVIDQSGNLTRAVASAVVANQSFIDGIHHVQVPSSTNTGSCGLGEVNYDSPFFARVTGSSIAGGFDLEDLDSDIFESCFDPLLGVTLVEVEAS